MTAVDDEFLNSTSSRSIENINKILTYAKLEPSELSPHVQCINFANDLNSEELRLIELDKDLHRCLLEGESLTVRGEKHDSAVLCTSKKTYDMKEAETSNSLLLLTDLNFSLPNDEELQITNQQVQSVKYRYYELKTCKPRLTKLKQILDKSHYSGRLHEETDQKDTKKFSFDELLDLVQASEMELKSALLKLNVLTMNGKQRILEFDYLSQVVFSIFTLLDEKQWNFDAIPSIECCDSLEELYPREVTLHVLDCYGEAVENLESVFTLQEDKICRFLAEVVLKNTGKFNFQDFMDTWKQTIPQEMNTDLQQIQGLALIDRSSKPETISYFPVNELSESIQERFQALFKAKEKWTLDEITPYVDDLSSETCTVSSLLTKNCRTSTQNSIKMFSSRQTR